MKGAGGQKQRWGWVRAQMQKIVQEMTGGGRKVEKWAKEECGSVEKEQGLCEGK